MFNVVFTFGPSQSMSMLQAEYMRQLTARKHAMQRHSRFKIGVRGL
jgi:hypothetical protein